MACHRLHAYRYEEPTKSGGKPPHSKEIPMNPVDPFKESRFEAIAEEARKCRVCAGMSGRTAVLSRLNGSLNPKVLFVAEAPGRRGGDRTRVPMSGDSSGSTFRHLLRIGGIAERFHSQTKNLFEGAARNQTVATPRGAA